MGTRGLIKVKINNKLYTIYIQYDTYFPYLGIKLVEFIKSQIVKEGLVGLLNYFNSIKPIDLTKPILKSDIAPNALKIISAASRACRFEDGMDIIKLWQLGYMPYNDNDIGFEEDTLMCENVYTLDLDRKLFCHNDCEYQIDNIPVFANDYC
jgi:hypothetical protein